MDGRIKRGRRPQRWLWVAALCLAAQSFPASAVTFQVTKVDDTADGTCSIDDCSLREAIIAANANPGPDTIVLPAGQGPYTLTRTGSPEEGALTGDLDITESLTITGPGGHIIDGGGTEATPTDRVFEIHAGTVVIENVTIQGGSPADAPGGGIRNAGALTLRNVVVQDNVGTLGGGIHNGLYRVSDSNAPSGPTFNFIDIASTGTAIDVSAEASEQAIGFPFTFYGRVFEHLWVSPFGYLSFVGDSVNRSSEQTLPSDDDPQGAAFAFWDNLAPQSGEVFVETQGSAPNRRLIVQYDDVAVSGTSATVTFQVILEETTNALVFQYLDVESDATTQGASASIGLGGLEDVLGGVQYAFGQAALSNDLAVRFEPGLGVLSLDTVTLQNNAATKSDDSEGGGLYNNGTAALTASTISGNSAVIGGGIANRGGTLTVTGSSITSNTGTDIAGGLSNRWGSTTLDNAMVTNNNASEDGGGVFNHRGDLIIRNSSEITGHADGGGIFSVHGSVRIADSSISNNANDRESGGAITMRMGQLVIENSLISGNEIGDEGNNQGGGIDVVKTDVTITGTTISNNVNNNTGTTFKDTGGGIRAENSNLIVADSTISGNEAAGAFGGGIANNGFFDYTVADSTSSAGPAFDFEDISRRGTALSLGDNDAAAVDIGFDFRFYDFTGSTVSIGSNGLLNFDDGSVGFDPASTDFACGDSDQAPNLAIYAFWTDLDPSVAGGIFTQTRGVAPNRRFIVQYQDIPFAGVATDESVTFQVKLFEGSNEIEVHYATARPSRLEGGRNVQVAVESGDGYPTSCDSLTLTCGGGASLPGFVEATQYATCDVGANRLGDSLAVRFTPTGVMRLENTVVSNNSAGTSGGAIYTRGMTDQVAVLLESIGVPSGTASAQTMVPSVINTTISGNMGTAIDNEGGLLVYGSTLSGNVGDGGAALRNAGRAALIQSTVSGNEGSDGAGIVNDDGGALDLQAVTIVDNDGIGVVNRANALDLTIANTVIANSTDQDLSDLSAGGITPLRNNFVGDGGLAGALQGDPQLAALADNGGPTQTHLPLPGSPLIDAGDTGTLPRDLFDVDGDGDVEETVPFDQRGPLFFRTRNPQADIGALEVQDDPIEGDLNRDGVIDREDRRLFLRTLGSTSSDARYDPSADFDEDGDVDLADYRAFRQLFRG